MHDEGRLSLVAAVQLSYVSEDVQRAVAEVKKPISKEMAVKIREKAESTDDALQIISGDFKRKKGAMHSVKIDAALYKKYFNGTRISDVTEIIEHALELWLKKIIECLIRALSYQSKNT